VGDGDAGPADDGLQRCAVTPVDGVGEPGGGVGAEGSVAANVNVAAVPATTGGTSTTAAVGAALVIVSVAVSVATLGPSVTCKVTVTGPAGPSPNPNTPSWAGFNVGVTPVASSNWPSPSTSQAKVAAAATIATRLLPVVGSVGH
jgi:hypothetical protein